MTDSPHPPEDALEIEAREPLKYGLNLFLFALTVPSVFLAGTFIVDSKIAEELPHRLSEIWRGWPFALPLLGILLAHEFGHYIAARIHRVPASLPYFIPLPELSPFGTMGAIIAMRGRIRSRAALLDIGAAGPIAGMVVALPVLALGLHWSTVGPNPSAHYVQEGQSLLYSLMKRVFLGPIPEGMDVQLSPTAEAGWVGFLITMINLVPWGQLDGGHIAFALFGERQHRVARFVRLSMLGLFAYNLLKFYAPIALHRSALDYRLAIGDSLFWLVWFAVTGIIGWASGGPDHPPFEPSELGPGRRAIAWLCLAMFVLLFMPTPWAQY
ncbi:MAG TPA: site-2 protease family protein [Polyangiaceae bacterium]|jgi:membrane-associated protease RseP (regulator of RpoE activity)